MRPSQDLSFTGGASLQGIEKLIHEIMMLNELQNGFGAYELKHAYRGRSGYSFGGNQMDLRQNGKARVVLTDILVEHHVDTKIIQRIIDVVQTEERLDPIDKEIINDALSSQHGREKINKIYVEEINKRSEYVKGIISNSNSMVQDIVNNSAHAQAFLFDYHNQLNIKENGKMHNFLKGNEVKLYDDKPIKLNLDELTEKKLIDQLKSFVHKTKYYCEPGSDQAKRQADIKRRHVNINVQVAKYEAKLHRAGARKAASRSNNYNNNPILPEDKKPYKKEEIHALAKEAVANNSKIDNHRELNGMRAGNDTSHRYRAVIESLAYANKVKSYGFGLAEYTKTAKEDYNEICKQYNNDLQHPEVIRAENALNAAVKEQQEFQNIANDAMTWGEFTVSMASSVANIFGFQEEARNIEFYGGHLIAGGIAAAQLYAGDPRGLVGLTSSIMALAGGKPKASPEHRMLKAIMSQLVDMRKDLNEIKNGISIIIERMQAISQQIERLQVQLNLIANLGVEILMQTQLISNQLSEIRNEIYQYFLAGVEIYSGLKLIKPALKDGDRLDQGNKILDYHNIIRLYTREVAHQDVIVAANVEANVAQLNLEIIKRDKFRESERSNNSVGLLQSINLFLRYVIQHSTTQFNTENLVNLILWEDGILVRLAFLSELDRQGLMNSLLSNVGIEAVCNSLAADVYNAMCTLDQLSLVAKSNFVEKLVMELHEAYRSIVNIYAEHDYRSDAKGLDQYVKEAIMYRNTVQVDNGQLRTTIPNHWPQAVNFPTVQSKTITIPIQGRNQTSNYESELHISDSYGVLVGFSATVDDQHRASVKVKKITYTNWDNHPSRVPNGISCDVEFGEEIIEYIAPNRGEGHPVRGSVPVKTNLKVKLEYVRQEDWDQKFFEMNCVNPDSNPVYRYDQDVEKMRNVYNQVQDERLKILFEQIINVKKLLTTIFEFYVEDKSICTRLQDLLAWYRESHETFINDVLSPNSVPWVQAWEGGYPNFDQFINHHLKRVRDSLNQVLDASRSAMNSFEKTAIYNRFYVLIERLLAYQLRFKTEPLMSEKLDTEAEKVAMIDIILDHSSQIYGDKYLSNKDYSIEELKSLEFVPSNLSEDNNDLLKEISWLQRTAGQRSLTMTEIKRHAQLIASLPANLNQLIDKAIDTKSTSPSMFVNSHLIWATKLDVVTEQPSEQHHVEKQVN